MNRHARKATYFLALSLIFTGCSSPAPEAEAVEQEVTVETPANEEVNKTEEVDTTESEDISIDEATVQGDSDIVDTGATSEEATTKEEFEQTSEPESKEVHETTAEETKPVETEMTTKEEPTVEETISEEVVVETSDTDELTAEEVAVDEPVVDEPVVEESAVEEPVVEEPVAEEPTGLTGTFSATGNSYDDYGWKPSLSLTFENGTITNVNYDEINADGAKKSKDTGYLSYFNQQTGVKLDEVYKTLSKDLLAVQTPESVDSVSGATIASDNFVKLAKKIIADNQ